VAESWRKDLIAGHFATKSPGEKVEISQHGTPPRY
jgi:hypothetical protein